MARMVSFYFLPMKFRDILLQSKDIYENQPNQVEKIASIFIFTEGAKWMAQKMCIIDPETSVSIDKFISFNRYGFLKYTVCLTAFIASFLLFFNINIFLIPFSILVFYFIEVHFLFLFPLLIDKTPYPIWKSIKTTYKIGLIKAIFIVIRIAMFMLFGILNSKQPLKNWHIGCLFILIWYQNEVRNRIRYEF